MLLLTVCAFLGCEHKISPTPMPQSQLLSALQLIEWDISNHVGHTIRIEGVGDADGKCEIQVKQGVRLVTQESPVEAGVLIYVLDSSGTTSTKINVEPTTALRRGRKDGFLYEENGEPVITLTRIGT